MERGGSVDGSVGILLVNCLMGFKEFSAPIMIYGSMEVDKHYPHDEGGINIDAKSSGLAHMHIKLLNCWHESSFSSQIGRENFGNEVEHILVGGMDGSFMNVWKILWREKSSSVLEVPLFLEHSVGDGQIHKQRGDLNYCLLLSDRGLDGVVLSICFIESFCAGERCLCGSNSHDGCSSCL